MADQVIFNRDAVGVVSSANWTDAETVNRIAYGYNDPIYTAASVFPQIPNGDGGGVSKLSSALAEYLPLAQNCSKELSDACSVLGSGAQSAMANFDAAETMSASASKKLRDRMGQAAMGDD